ncbi:MAG: LapA family protein [Komagataeibacter hansenii]|nr:LapA family protein [Novacetimonas hansenii]
MIRLFITLPFVLGLIILAACNQGSTPMTWLELKWDSSPGVLALVTGAVFYALGYVCAWIGTLGQIRRARKAEQQVRTLETETATLRASLAANSAMAATATPPSAYAAAPIAPAQPQITITQAPTSTIPAPPHDENRT